MSPDETILSELSEPLLVLDESLHAVKANPAFYEAMNIPPGQLEGKSVEELIAERSAQPRLGALLDAVFAHDKDLPDTHIVCTIPAQSPQVLAVSARKIHIPEYSEAMVLVELRDITDLTNSEERCHELNLALEQHVAELENANTELESFAHSVSHDLRAPLRLTNRIANLLLQEHGAQLPPEAVEKVHMILDSTLGMGKLIENLLSFSQVGRTRLKKRRIDVERLVHEAVHDLSEELQVDHAGVEIDDLPSCRADRSLLKQVFVNLLENALKFSGPRENPSIRVGCTQSSEGTVYFVRDNGIGFDMSKYDSLFRAFHRLHRGDQFEGSGLGLALAKRIVDSHGGRIWAESELDRGTTFYFTLGE